MIDIFNPDFQDLIRSLEKRKVEYLLVGGYAVIMHGYQRTTADLDIWVNRTEPNYFKLMDAFLDFGLPTVAVIKDTFLNDIDIVVYRFGMEPSAVDIIIQLDALPFNEAYSQATIIPLDETLSIKVVNLPHLIKLKKAANRYKDLNDLEHLPPL